MEVQYILGIINTTLQLIFSHELCIMNMCYVYKYVAVNIYSCYVPITDIIIQSLYNGNYIRLYRNKGSSQYVDINYLIVILVNSMLYCT